MAAAQKNAIEAEETKDTVRPKREVVDANPVMVKATITKFGSGKVSTGQHVAGEGDIYADRGDVISIDSRTADKLEACGLVETV